jgi:hypothetical protein
MFARRNQLARRVLCGIDLAIDLATLGEYGLEPLPADGSCRELAGRRPGWEELARARRGACERPFDCDRDAFSIRDRAR